MKIEHEIKILDIDAEAIRSLLHSKNAESKGTLNFRRYIFELPQRGESEWLRLRTDGNKTTLTYKNAQADRIDGVAEIEIEVSDIDVTKELLDVLGYAPKKYQENSRELYLLDDVEVSIDRWPGIPPYVEIEGKDTAAVEGMIRTLNLADHRMTSDTVAAVYELYSVNMDEAQKMPTS